MLPGSNCCSCPDYSINARTFVLQFGKLCSQSFPPAGPALARCAASCYNGYRSPSRPGGGAVLILERTDPFMNSLETFTNQLIQHGTDLGAKLLSALVVLVIGLSLCRWVIRLVQHSRALDKLCEQLAMRLGLYSRHVPPSDGEM